MLSSLLLVLAALQAQPARGASAPLRVLGVTRLGDTLETFPLRFASGAEAIVWVDETGRAFARRPGSATVTARAGGATARVDVRVAPAADVTYALEPADATARTGDVVRFRVARSRGRTALESGAGARLHPVLRPVDRAPR